MSRRTWTNVALLGVFLAITALAGCGSDNKEGGAAGSVAVVGDTACFQCHAATADPLTGETFIEQYQRSLHAELGCESCHGGGAQHNGVGPFPYELNSETTDGVSGYRGRMRKTRLPTCMRFALGAIQEKLDFLEARHLNLFSPH